MLQSLEGCTVTTSGPNPNFDASGNYIVTFDTSGVQYTYDQYVKKLNELVIAYGNNPPYLQKVITNGILLAPYARAFANAYLDAHPDIIPEHPYINSNNYIYNGYYNWVNYNIAYYGLTGSAADVHGIATHIA